MRKSQIMSATTAVQIPRPAKAFTQFQPVTVIALTALAFEANAAAPEIPKLKLQPEITVSGLSSGGYMANQLHIAHSTQIKGAAIIAAGPYGCAQNSLAIALDHCFNKATSTPDLAIADTQMQQLASAGKSDDLKNLAGAKVW